MQIGIIDYGMGNLRSVQWALERLGASVRWIRHGRDWSNDDAAVVLPGVGAFARGMEELQVRELRAPVAAWLAQGRPFLGICLGFQFLFDGSSEGAETAGFGVFDGMVSRLPEIPNLKIPQIGWNDIQVNAGPLLPFSGRYFYFVHSFAAPESVSSSHAVTHYGRPFVSAAVSGHIWGTQFHPERSGTDGLALLEVFLQTVPSTQEKTA